MLRNYLKIAFRNILKHKFYSILNVLGLAIGMASALLITLYIQHELSYDKFYEHSDRIYRLNTLYEYSGFQNRYATTPPPLSKALMDEIPEVEAATRLFLWSDFTMRPDNDLEKIFRETRVWHVDENFFKVLNFGLLEGDKETALMEPGSLILPKSTAIKYFGREAYDKKEIIGRTLLGGKDGGTVRKITGIMEDQPDNAHWQFDILIASNGPIGKEGENNWSWNVGYTYVLLKEKAGDAIDKKLDQIVEKYAMPFMGMTPAEFEAQNYRMRYVLQPITDIHLKSDYHKEIRPNGHIAYVYTFIAIAIFIILIACVNFMNLSTAQSANRAKEVGVKKVLGVSKGYLIGQFLTESILFSLIALVIAFGLVELFLNVYQRFFDNLISFDIYNVSGWILTFSGTIFIGILAGIYPAFYLTAFEPVKVLKGNLRSGIKSKGLRNGLVIFQFTVSIALMICTIVVMKQVDYIRSKNLGFEKENVVVLQNDKEIDERREEFKKFLSGQSKILSTSFSTGIPGLKQFHMRGFTQEGQQQDMGIRWYEADDSYLETLGIELVAGRNFNKEIISDTSGILLNEAAVKMLGLADPVGKYIIKNLGENDEERLRILGVMKNFNYESFRSQIKPLAIQYLDNFTFKDYITIRIAGGDIDRTLGQIKAGWNEFEPQVPMTMSFLDQDFDQLFKAEMRLKNIFGVFTGLAIFIACLGLFGLAAYTAEQRKKEIGVRKTLGATVANIATILSKNFVFTALIGFMLAIPISWFAMDKWLMVFAFKIELEPYMFLLSGLMAVFIAAITVSYQSIKAAIANPIEALKDE
ncbi:ABC transporter permease [Fulvivirgaceae bacterium BMA10]|uniref:ABC transporter permease n=1 Tax=Splendidivirga corallicola TaxID=3051826 RepID=A0ABT8KXC8_9BACT|nr:ABC transporter permease [Fulvivirgaceae bacterium BMA10]